MQAAVQNMTRVAGPILAAGIIAAERFHLAFGGFAIATTIAAIMMSRVRVAAHDIVPDSLGVFGRMAVGFRHARSPAPRDARHRHGGGDLGLRCRPHRTDPVVHQ